MPILTPKFQEGDISLRQTELTSLAGECSSVCGRVEDHTWMENLVACFSLFVDVILLSFYKEDMMPFIITKHDSEMMVFKFKVNRWESVEQIHGPGLRNCLSPWAVLSGMMLPGSTHFCFSVVKAPYILLKYVEVCYCSCFLTRIQLDCLFGISKFVPC